MFMDGRQDRDFARKTGGLRAAGGALQHFYKRPGLAKAGSTWTALPPFLLLGTRGMPSPAWDCLLLDKPAFYQPTTAQLLQAGTRATLPPHSSFLSSSGYTLNWFTLPLHMAFKTRGLPPNTFHFLQTSMPHTLSSYFCASKLPPLLYAAAFPHLFSMYYGTKKELSLCLNASLGRTRRALRTHTARTRTMDYGGTGRMRTPLPHSMPDQPPSRQRTRKHALCRVSLKEKASVITCARCAGAYRNTPSSTAPCLSKASSNIARCRKATCLLAGRLCARRARRYAAALVFSIRSLHTFGTP